MQTVSDVFCTSPQPFNQPPPSICSIMAADQNSFSYQFSDCRQQENWSKSYESDDDEDVLEGFLKEIDVKGHEMIKKLVSRVENDVPFEEAFRETWHHLGGKPAASRMLEKIARKMGRERDNGDGGVERRERGLDGDDLKNERFKVKTLNVKEEEGHHD
ncbi:hypothetical protein C2S52_022172 [Perilla frutescens var. hirtella]|nr:hypothetical protein C2S52_022172 [Perilla frutescens var. hirtella]KAH6807430.1 hypothetical protein C2S51_028538 [Perilla frutescens var. frutescens]